MLELITPFIKHFPELFHTPVKSAKKEKEEEEKQQAFIRVIAQLVDQPQQRPFYLFATDTTPYPRPHARTLIDRGYIYQMINIGLVRLIGKYWSVFVDLQSGQVLDDLNFMTDRTDVR